MLHLTIMKNHKERKLKIFIENNLGKSLKNNVGKFILVTTFVCLFNIFFSRICFLNICHQFKYKTCNNRNKLQIYVYPTSSTNIFLLETIISTITNCGCMKLQIAAYQKELDWWWINFFCLIVDQHTMKVLV